MHTRWVLGAVLVTGTLAGCTGPQAPAPTWAPPAEAPPHASAPTEQGIAGLPDAAWVERVAAASGIPARALAAYAGAALLTAEVNPDCAIPWNTLAGLGAVESDHGRHAGSRIGPDGTAEPGIFGVALDGGGTDTVTDSDDGAIDGDAVHDRAVGPLQLIPESWRNWGYDGNGDGAVDPQNIDDAAVAAANYLCRASRDAGAMTTEVGWRAGIDAYNSAGGYAEAVASAAIAAAEAATAEDPTD